MVSNNRGLWTSLCLFFIAISFVFADDHGVTFIYPTSGLTFNYLDTVNVTYTSPFPKPLLYTNCKKASNGALFPAQTNDVTPFNGSYLVLLDFKSVSSCQFDLRPNTSAGYGANGPFWILRSTSGAPTTLGLSEPTQSPSTTSTSPSTSTSAGSDDLVTSPPDTEQAPTVAPTATPLPTTSAASHSGLSTGATVGIGISAAVAVLALAGGIFLIFYRRRQSSHRDRYSAPDPDTEPIQKTADSEPAKKRPDSEPLTTRSSSSFTVARDKSYYGKGGPPGYDPNIHELGDTQTYELSTLNGPHEIDSRNQGD